MKLRVCVAGWLVLLVFGEGCAASRPAFEQSYQAARTNWAFRTRYPRADRLLNAFDYGHAVLYQTLIAHRDAAARLEGPELSFITNDLLRYPPDLPLDESAIGPDYAKLAPELLALFDWAHVLHRQVYDIWATPGLSDAERDAAVARAVRYYQSRPDLALSDKPKSMMLMEGQPYSKVFRQEGPKFNGLLWSYHWFQMALYDAMMATPAPGERAARIDKVIDEFFAMLVDAPTRMPREMPMAPTAAPMFSARYPAAAVIFDNLHALHDVIADILASPIVPRDQKRRAILAASAAYRDDTTSVTTIDEWRSMAAMMARPR